MLKNKEGVITIESMIAVSILVIVMTTLMSIVTYFLIQDTHGQALLDLLDEVEVHNYLFEKMGIVDFQVLDEYHFLLEKLPIEPLKKVLNRNLNQTKSMYLNSVFLKGLSKIEENYELKSWSFKDNILRSELSLMIKLPFGYQKSDVFILEKRFWLFGSNAELFKHITLADLINQTKRLNDQTKVYVTKTGKRYHLFTCFYINRSTTNQSAIRMLTLKVAKLRYEPCKLCILGGGLPWRWAK